MYLRRSLQAIIDIKPSELGIDTYTIILKKLQSKYEGKCITEGYVRKDSIRLLKFSLGKADDPYSGKVRYSVDYSADILYPATGLIITATITLTTKMGIRAKLTNDSDNPLDILVPRDHYVDDPYYNSLKEDDECKLEVVASKFKWGAVDIFVLAKINEPPKVAIVAPEESKEQEINTNIEPPQFNISFEPDSETKSVSLSETNETNSAIDPNSGETKSVAFTPEKKIIRKKKPTAND
jgi:DNA-directed RNA polymerase subunit E'/Rpb7